MTDYRVGCSGFSYKEWKNIFYPADLPQGKWFSFYCEHFNTLELNVTFYRFPEVKSLRKWYDESPQDFIFSVKAPRLITHHKRFAGTQELISRFYGTLAEGLREKAGCILFQLPASFVYSEANLLLITEQLDPSFTNVIEFREAGWWKEQVYQTLARKNITFCSISHPSLPDAVICHTPLVYYRFHGVPKLYYSAYSKKYLQETTDHVRSCRKVKQAYFYFNNTAEGHALQNARQLEEYYR